jgi:hypothetical protein
MIDPKTYASLLQAPQEAIPSAAEIARMQRRELSFVLHAWNQFRMQEVLAEMEDRRMAVRRRILSELSRLDRAH